MQLQFLMSTNATLLIGEAESRTFTSDALCHIRDHINAQAEAGFASEDALAMYLERALTPWVHSVSPHLMLRVSIDDESGSPIAYVGLTSCDLYPPSTTVH